MYRAYGVGPRAQGLGLRFRALGVGLIANWPLQAGPGPPQGVVRRLSKVRDTQCVGFRV